MKRKEESKNQDLVCLGKDCLHCAGAIWNVVGNAVMGVSGGLGVDGSRGEANDRVGRSLHLP
jgi:hypothetical protein